MIFQSTLPLRGATAVAPFASIKGRISIHAPLTGSDKFLRKGQNRERISIHAPLTGSDLSRTVFWRQYQRISIHAPLTGSDAMFLALYFLAPNFNPRSPYGERPGCLRQARTGKDFNPRSPYGERQYSSPRQTPRGDFNPRSPYGERLPGMLCQVFFLKISIHAPLTGSDHIHKSIIRISQNFNPRSPYGERLLDRLFHIFDILFQSTLPLRGATSESEQKRASGGISIHAPLTGSDPLRRAYKKRRNHFNPRSPYGERQVGMIWDNRNFKFQSTLPLRGATRGCPCFLEVVMISIHAPLTGSDQENSPFIAAVLISIHAPLTGSDVYVISCIGGVDDFNPRSPYGERQPVGSRLRMMRYFNPRSPYGERPSSEVIFCAN